MDARLALEEHGIRPTSQRLAIAQYLLVSDEHPSADLVWERVKAYAPHVSRATVYNTLALFVEHGLVRAYTLTEGATVYDPRTEPHHHFIDDATGVIHDLPWESLEVRGIDGLAGYDVHDHQVVLRGSLKKP